MADLDKKTQKNQPDLVQSVLEAYEKRNVERVDILITNALKQLKGSRFKPDLSICISLFYLARVQPKVFSQSQNLKEFLKTHIKRDGVPANVKGNKTDFFLPVLAANVLIASCDSIDVRATILTRIGQWISSNQKLNELIHHLLAILCVRCDDDPATIKTLIEMRHQWFDFLESNFITYGRVSPNLAHSIRGLLARATTCESLVENLTFLIKHDSDVVGLCSAVSKFLVQKPLTFKNILANKDHSERLMGILLGIFDSYFQIHANDSKETVKKLDDVRMIVFSFQSSSQVVCLDEIVVKALLLLMPLCQFDQSDMIPNVNKFMIQWLTEAKLSPNLSKVTFSDLSLTTPYQFPVGLLSNIIRETKNSLYELAIYSATPTQLLDLAFTFGLKTSALNDILERLDVLEQGDFSATEAGGLIYFGDLLDHYTEIGVQPLDKLREHLISSNQEDGDVKNHEQLVDIKIKKEIT